MKEYYSEAILVSVIIPTYNNRLFIRDAVESALSQGVSMEIIVIDDCSVDGTKEEISDYIDHGLVIYLQNKKNLGVAESRNNGINIARGKYIAFLDADDVWSPNKLSVQIAYMQEHNCQLCATARRLILEDGTKTDRVIHIESRITYEKLLRHNSISCSSVVVEKRLALEVPMTHSEVHEDYLTWLRMLKICEEAAGIDIPLLDYRLTKTGKSRKRLKSAKMTYGVYRIMGITKGKSYYFLFSHLMHGIKKYINIGDKRK